MKKVKKRGKLGGVHGSDSLVNEARAPRFGRLINHLFTGAHMCILPPSREAANVHIRTRAQRGRKVTNDLAAHARSSIHIRRRG